MANSNSNTAQSSGGSPQKKRSSWRFIERAFAIVGAVASLIAVIAAVRAGIEHTSIFQLRHEEAMVSTLIPGDDYAKIEDLVGTQPDFHEHLHSGRQLYVFNRRWEYVQLVVDNAGTVLSIGVYAKTAAFKATLVTGTVVNGSSAGQQISQPIVGISGECGASWYFYYQGYAFPDAGNAYSEAVGYLPVTDRDHPNASPAVCDSAKTYQSCFSTYWRKNAQLYPPPMSASLLSCLNSYKAGQEMINMLRPAVVIVTAPHQAVVPDMLNDDYFHTLAS